MLNFICFGSGSSGNCYYFNVLGHGILVDLGISLRTLRKYFSDYGLSMAQIEAVLVTHDHADHVRYVGAFSKEFHVPVYALPGVFMGMDRNRFMRKKVPADLRRTLEYEKVVEIGPFSITPFAVPHDSAANSGFCLQVGDRRFCLMTDVGHITETLRRYLRDAHYVVVEANYDNVMLETGPYPYYLKRRIQSPNGHLDNVACGNLLAEELSSEARRVWLCHLSEENNHPDKALQTVKERMSVIGRPRVGENYLIEPLQRKHPSPLYSLD